jgi:hypothetical protein
MDHEQDIERQCECGCTSFDVVDSGDDWIEIMCCACLETHTEHIPSDED